MGAATAIAWEDYAPFDARVTGALRDADRADAEDHFARLMAARPDRVARLARLAARHGVDLAAPDAPARLGAWLLAAAPAASADPARWTGVVADTSLWLGERIIAQAPALAWKLFTRNKKATGYQRPVLSGFTRVAPDYYVDIAFMVASWADLAARRRLAKPDFLATIEAVTLKDA